MKTPFFFFFLFLTLLFSCKKTEISDTPVSPIIPNPIQQTEQPNIPKGYYIGKTSYELKKAIKFYNIDSIRKINNLYDPNWPIVPSFTFLDLNNDGFEDIYSPNRVSDNSELRPTIFLYKNKSFQINDDIISLDFKGTSVTRKTLVGDYNNDSLPDIFLINHGYEKLTDIGVGTFYYEYCGVLLSSKNGNYQYKQLIEYGKKFWHGGASGDLNGDGNLDVVLAVGEPLILLGDGKGGFVKSNIQLNVGNSNGYVTAEIVDVDKDGKNDIILCGDEGQPLPALYSESSIFLNKGNSYEKVIITQPNTNGWRYIMEIACEDIDNDGINEIFLIRTGDNTGVWYGGYWINLYKKDNLGKYKDVTNDFIKDNQLINTNTGKWMYKMVVKKEADGFFGIYAYATNLSPIQYWKQNANKIFIKY